MKRRLLVVAVAFTVGLAGAQAIALVVWLFDDTPEAAGLAALPVTLRADAPAERTVEAYEGLGAWVDAFDYAPSFQSGGRPPVTPADVEDMADLGVRTLFLQAARDDSPDRDAVVDPAVTAQFLLRAHRRDMRVVAWYLPHFDDVEADLAQLDVLDRFEALGHRFDGIALDIEWTESVPDHRARSARLVELSGALRDLAGDDAIGAIVLPPVQIEVVNTALWPGFPWRDVAPFYDVWLPMAYWTERRAASGYRDGFAYTDENVRRLRRNLGDADATVHAIGGLADDLTAEQLAAFSSSLEATGSVGASIYDWQTLNRTQRAQLGQVAEALR